MLARTWAARSFAFGLGFVCMAAVRLLQVVVKREQRSRTSLGDPHPTVSGAATSKVAGILAPAGIARLDCTGSGVEFFSAKADGAPLKLRVRGAYYGDLELSHQQLPQTSLCYNYAA